jgi:hypothetical protein
MNAALAPACADYVIRAAGENEIAFESTDEPSLMVNGHRWAGLMYAARCPCASRALPGEHAARPQPGERRIVADWLRYNFGAGDGYVIVRMASGVMSVKIGDDGRIACTRSGDGAQLTTLDPPGRETVAMDDVMTASVDDLGFALVHQTTNRIVPVGASRTIKFWLSTCFPAVTAVMLWHERALHALAIGSNGRIIGSVNPHSAELALAGRQGMATPARAAITISAKTQYVLFENTFGYYFVPDEMALRPPAFPPQGTELLLIEWLRWIFPKGAVVHIRTVRAAQHTNLRMLVSSDANRALIFGGLDGGRLRAQAHGRRNTPPVWVDADMHRAFRASVRGNAVTLIEV